MDRGGCRATVHGVAEGGTQLSTAHGRKQLLAGKSSLQEVPLCLATNLKEAPPCSIHLLALAHLSDLLITEYLANLLVLSIDQRSRN